MKYPPGVEWHLVVDLQAGECVQLPEERGGKPHALSRSLPLRRGVDGSGEEAGDMAGHSVGGLGVQQVGEVGSQPIGRKPFQEPSQPGRQERFVQPCAGSRFHAAESGLRVT